ncbi:MAG: hypothetical protein RLZZ180_238 [Pseudomonadota bacterium]|jgi:FixJ family two-component response regulator
MGSGQVFLVDDDEALRFSIADLLTFAGYGVRTWRDAQAFLQDLPASQPAVLLTDMRMPGLSGIDLHAELLRRDRCFPVVYLTGESTLSQGIDAMKLGAFDFLLKPFARDTLLAVVAAALAQAQARWAASIDRLRAQRALSSLSPREREVHRLLLRGCGNREIVDALGISLPTAKQYKTEVMRKLGAQTLSQVLAHGRLLEGETQAFLR